MNQPIATSASYLTGPEPRGAELCADDELRGRLLAAYEAIKVQYDVSPYIEGQIYDGFASPADEQLMDKFHVTPWEGRHLLVTEFEDARFQLIGKRLLYVADPNHLPEVHRSEVADHIRSRIAASDAECGKWTTLTKALAECDKELASCDAEGVLLIQAYRAYLTQRIDSLS